MIRPLPIFTAFFMTLWIIGGLGCRGPASPYSKNLTGGVETSNTRLTGSPPRQAPRTVYVARTLHWMRRTCRAIRAYAASCRKHSIKAYLEARAGAFPIRLPVAIRRKELAKSSTRWRNLWSMR